MAANRLYVGNLSFHTTEAALRSAVAAFGNVEAVDMPVDRETGRLRGFAFVTMTRQEDAERAIAELNGSSLDGRALRVNVAEDRPQRGGGGGGGFRGGSRGSR
ncbi:MAG: RNA-binding protein [Deltaproteobacteria bacterium]|nr:RNA-binding protein [Deltaproteobacteria bacterium]